MKRNVSQGSDTGQPPSTQNARYNPENAEAFDGEAMSEARRRRLVQAREHARLRSARAASVKFGWPESTYRSHENGTRTFDKVDAEKYAAAFGVSFAWVWDGKGPMLTEPENRPIIPQPAAIAPSSNVSLPVQELSLTSRRFIPVRGTTKGGPEGALLLDDTVSEHVPCLASLEGVPDAYAVYVLGDSMEPRYFAGELVYLHPHRPARKGDFVVVQIDGGDGSRLGYIKRYVGRTDQFVICEQLNPATEVRFERAKVAEIHVIAGSTSF